MLNALNLLGPHDTLLPLGQAGAQSYGAAHVLALAPWLLAAAMLLLLLDAVLALRSAWIHCPFFSGKRSSAGGRACADAASPRVAHADDAIALKAALDTRLAYVATGLPDIDATSKAGLTGLGYALKARTSYEPEEPLAVDLERDDLSFYPLLYWPMDPREEKSFPPRRCRASTTICAWAAPSFRHP